MADSTNSRTQAPRGTGRARSPGLPFGAAVEVSLGFVVDETDPDVATGLCGSITSSAPPGARVEFLVLDDHTNPRRRELVGVVDQQGDAVRVVPRPPQSGCAELDALSQGSGSEFIVVGFGEATPWSALAAAMGELWADGADVVAVGGLGPDTGSVVADAEPHARLAEYLGLAIAGEHADDVGRFVIVRRWVARWLFSEVAGNADVGSELADRARLLGLRMLVLDTQGMPVSTA